MPSQSAVALPEAKTPETDAGVAAEDGLYTLGTWRCSLAIQNRPSSARAPLGTATLPVGRCSHGNDSLGVRRRRERGRGDVCRWLSGA